MTPPPYCCRCLAFAAALAGSLPGYASANDRDLRATSIPASACVDASRDPSSARVPAARQNGAVILVENEYDLGAPSVNLECPLPLNNIDLGGTTNDNDMSSYTVLYEDKDGVAESVYIDVTLWMTQLNTAGVPTTTRLCYWNSNRNGAPGKFSSNLPCVVDLAATAFYFFRVAMATNGDLPVEHPDYFAAFHGIRFP